MLQTNLLILKYFLVNNNIDIILIGTESHLDESHSNHVWRFFLTNTYVTTARNCYGGGGVFILLKSTVLSYQIDVGPTSIEIIWAYLHIGKSGTIVGSFYGQSHSRPAPE